MLFWFFVILTVVGIFLYIFSEKIYRKYSEWLDTAAFIGTITAWMSGLIAVVMLALIVVSNICADGNRLSIQEKYKALKYKAQTGACRDEFGIVNKEFIDEVQEWNMDCVKYQRLQKDFWIGIFIPNIYDDFEVISLEEIQYRNNEK